MNRATEPASHYGAGAFDSTKLCALPAPKKATGTGVSGWLKKPLSWGGYSKLEPLAEMADQLAFQNHAPSSDARKVALPDISPYKNEVNWRFERGGVFPRLIIMTKLMLFFLFPMATGAVLADLLMPQNMPTIPMLLASIVMAGMCCYCLILFGTTKERRVYWIIFGSCIVTSLIIVLRKGALWNYGPNQIFLWVEFGVAFVACIGCDAVLAVYSRFYKWDGSEFNRQTGMVTISGSWWHFKLVAPFYEFDAQLQLSILPHGGHDYILWLQHRYTGRNLCLGNRVHSLGLSRHEALVTWDSLQRYMDISQPLPDQPILESTRHLDPTTAAHDLATHRPPHYWRDMKNTAWNRTTGNDLRDKIAAYPWQQQPCLIRAHTDPQLTVADYYARQESHGIQARSGGRPIMEIHG